MLTGKYVFIFHVYCTHEEISRRMSDPATTKVLSRLPTSHEVWVLISANCTSMLGWRLCQLVSQFNMYNITNDFQAVFFIMLTTAHLNQDSHIIGKKNQEASVTIVTVRQDLLLCFFQCQR